jgi:hemoglobin
MTRDLETRADIDRLLIEFYKVVIHDPEIGHHFDQLDLDHHLPIIGDFWEKVLFGNPVYFNNPLTVHQKLHERFPLLPYHFLRWVEIFLQTVGELYSGEMADLAKIRARAIADSLDQRLNGGVQISR